MLQSHILIVDTAGVIFLVGLASSGALNNAFVWPYPHLCTSANYS